MVSSRSISTTKHHHTRRGSSGSNKRRCGDPKKQTSTHTFWTECVSLTAIPLPASLQVHPITPRLPPSFRGDATINNNRNNDIGYGNDNNINPIDHDSSKALSNPSSLLSTSPSQGSATTSLSFHPVVPHILRTPLASDWMKELILDRLQKEIIKPLAFSLSQRRKDKTRKWPLLRENSLPNSDDNKDNDGSASLLQQQQHQQQQRRIQQRIIVGVNACMRHLEKVHQQPQPMSQPPPQATPCLILMAGQVSPPTMLVPTATVAMTIHQIPLILLPGEDTSRQMGRMLGTRQVAMLMFLCSSKTHVEQQQQHHCPPGTTRDNHVVLNDPDVSIRHVDRVIDSYVSYVLGKHASVLSLTST